MKIRLFVLGLAALTVSVGATADSAFFSYATQSYRGDAANNVVVDGNTGLEWRRCSEGQVWDGNTCGGTASLFTHAEAMAYAKGQAGWRLPMSKELSSLADRSRTSPFIDPRAFPETSPSAYWTATPYPNSANGSWVVNFNNGFSYGNHRSAAFPIRLVRAAKGGK